jgi:hypothetical protein
MVVASDLHPNPTIIAFFLQLFSHCLFPLHIALLRGGARPPAQASEYL